MANGFGTKKNSGTNGFFAKYVGIKGCGTKIVGKKCECLIH